MMTFPFLTSILLLPAIAGILILISPIKNRMFGFFISFTATLAGMGILVLAVQQSWSGKGFRPLTETHDWIPFLGSQLALNLDSLSFCFVLMSYLVCLICLVEMLHRANDAVVSSMAAVLFFTACCNGIFLADDMLILFFFFSLSILPVYALTWPLGSKQKKSGTRFFFIQFISSLCLLFGIVVLYYATNSASSYFTMQISKMQLIGTPFQFQSWALYALMIGFIIRAPLFPFHGWLIELLSEASAMTSILIATLFTKTAFYVLWKIIIPMTPQLIIKHLAVFMFLGIISLLYGAIISLSQLEVKRFLGFSILSFSGLISIGLFSLNQTSMSGAIALIFGHSICIMVLMIFFDRVTEFAGTDLLTDMKGIGRRLPFYSQIFLLTGFAYIGMPGFILFSGLFLIFSGVLSYQPVWALIAMGGVILGASAVISLFHHILISPESSSASGASSRIFGRDWILMIFLMSIIVWFGLQPQLMFNMIEPPVSSLETQLKSYRILNPSTRSSTTVNPGQRTPSFTHPGLSDHQE